MLLLSGDSYSHISTKCVCVDTNTKCYHLNKLLSHNLLWALIVAKAQMCVFFRATGGAERKETQQNIKERGCRGSGEKGKRKTLILRE